MRSEKSIQKMFDDLAEEYHTERSSKGTAYNEYTEMPATLKALGNVKNKKVLDLGCGSGLYVKKLAKKGAKVKGIDLSPSLIKFAKIDNPKVEFKVGSISKKLPYKTGEFDIVMSALVMHYIENWDSVLKEVRRVLKPNGIFVFSTENPFKTSVKKTVCNGKKFEEVKNYFDEKLKINKVKTPEGKKVTIMRYRKTYETIMKYVLKNNFEILDYVDAKPLLKAKKLFPKEYKKLIDFPYFCVWKLRKK